MRCEYDKIHKKTSNKWNKNSKTRAHFYNRLYFAH